MSYSNEETKNKKKNNNVNIYEIAVIGSGFGGAVLSCRLAQAGFKVCIFEKGKRWQPEKFPHQNQEDNTENSKSVIPIDNKVEDYEIANYPRGINKFSDLIWNEKDPFTFSGFNRFQIFPSMTVMHGIGVGGGSLHYVGVTLKPTKDYFKTGWPSSITYDELDPYFDKVAQMLDIKSIPENYQNERTKIVKKAMEKTGDGDRVKPVDLAFTFNKDWDENDLMENRKDFEKRINMSIRSPNRHGFKQGSCVNLGNCYSVGCDVDAKNSLNLNYIPLAEYAGADIKPLHSVTKIEPIYYTKSTKKNGLKNDSIMGYKVHYEKFNLKNKTLTKGFIKSNIVIVSAGSLGSTEILLKNKLIYKTLPKISSTLGTKWSCNGNFGGFVHFKDQKTYPTIGPSITTYTDFDENSNDFQHRFAFEDFGFPDLLNTILNSGKDLKGISKFIFKKYQKEFEMDKEKLDEFLDHTIIYGAMAKEGSYGKIMLKRKFWKFWGLPKLGKMTLYLKWSDEFSKDLYNEIEKRIKYTMQQVNGEYISNPLWTYLRSLIAVHPLGGVPMGNSDRDGVVNDEGEVFNYNNLFVADGSIFPKNVGRNPSMTIAAIAERIADKLISKISHEKLVNLENV